MSQLCGERGREQGSERPLAGPGKLCVLLVVVFLAFVSYTALLSAVPMWAATGGAASPAVGGTTGVMMAATVATQLAAPRLFKLLRLRGMMIAGAILLSVSAPLYVLSANTVMITMLAAVRGLGFALMVMSGATFIARLAGPGDLSSYASLYGVAAALPSVGALPGGVWAAENWGFPVVFWSSGAVCLLAAAIATALPGGAQGAFSSGAWADAKIAICPIVLLLMTAASFGAAATFLPISGPGAGKAAFALLLASGALVLGRLAAGFIGGRIGSGRVLTASTVITAAGLITIATALPHASWLLSVGAVAVGGGFGACQNDSFVTTIERLGPARTAAATTIWNIAYDGGAGLGAVIVGWIIGAAGYAGALLATGIAIAIIAMATRLIHSRLTGEVDSPRKTPAGLPGDAPSPALPDGNRQ